MRIITFLFFVFSTFVVYGQDSTLFKANLNALSKIDLKRKTDSLSSAYAKRNKDKLADLKHKADSLQAKGLPNATYLRKIDSIKQKMLTKFSTNEITEQLSSNKSKINDKLSKGQDSLQKTTFRFTNKVQEGIDKKRAMLDSVGINLKNPITNPLLPQSTLPNLPSAQLPVANSLPSGNPSLNINGLAVPALKDVPNSKDLNQLTNGIKEIEKKAADKISTQTKEMNKAKEGAKELSEAKSKIKDVKSELKPPNLDKAKLKEMEQKAKKDLEQQAKKDLEQKAKEAKDLKEINELKQKNPLEQYKDMVSQIKKEKGNISGLDVKKELPDPFVGKEEKLKAGIAELDRLKKKYVSIPDSRYLPIRTPNQMKGKPFKERFIPSLGFQLHDGSRTGIDLMPYFMYNVSGRIRLGAGFDYRLVGDSQTLLSSAQVFGFRALADFRVYGTWYFHLEGEWLHYERGSAGLPRFPSDPVTQEWGDRLNVGMLRTYKISRRFNGTFQALYYAGDWKSFPQTKNASIRFGFEYKLGEKKKSPAMK